MATEATILCVEDDEDIRFLIERALKRYFTTVLLAENGEEGYRVYREKKPDIILSDIQMPILDGIEMSRRIKKENPHIPIIVTSAYNEEVHLNNAKAIGIERYVRKPIVIKNLIETIYEVMGKKPD